LLVLTETILNVDEFPNAPLSNTSIEHVALQERHKRAAAYRIKSTRWRLRSVHVINGGHLIGNMRRAYYSSDAF